MLFFNKFCVPSWTLAYVFNKNPMYCYRVIYLWYWWLRVALSIKCQKCKKRLIVRDSQKTATCLYCKTKFKITHESKECVCDTMFDARKKLLELNNNDDKEVFFI